MVTGQAIFLFRSSIHCILRHLYAGIYKGLFNSYFLFADEMAALAEFKAVGMDARTSRSVVRTAVRPVLGI